MLFITEKDYVQGEHYGM